MSYADGERLWRETYSCGHAALTSTFIGDFDFEAAHRGLPALCTECTGGFPGALVDRVTVEQVPPDQWDQADLT